MPNKEFAPGLPSKTEYAPISQKGSTRLVIQKHIAEKAGKHYDMRLKGPGGIAHSWVIRSLPGERDKMLAVHQPTHTAKYMDFQGKIESGYGAGTVTKAYDQKVRVLSATNDRIKMVLPEGTFTMIKPKGFGDKNWLMIKSAAYPKKVPFTRAEQYENAFLGFMPGDKDNRKRFAYAQYIADKRFAAPKVDPYERLRKIPPLDKEAGMNYEQIRYEAFVDELEKIAANQFTRTVGGLLGSVAIIGSSISSPLPKLIYDPVVSKQIVAEAPKAAKAAKAVADVTRDMMNDLKNFRRRVRKDLPEGPGTGSLKRIKNIEARREKLKGFEPPKRFVRGRWVEDRYGGNQ